MYSKVQFTGKQDRKSSMNLYCAWCLRMVFLTCLMKTCRYHAHQGPFPTHCFILVAQTRKMKASQEQSWRQNLLTLWFINTRKIIIPPPIRQTSFKNIIIWNETVILVDGSLHHIKKMLYIFYNKKYLTQLTHNAKSQIDTFDQIYFHQVPIQTIYFRFSCLIHSH